MSTQLDTNAIRAVMWKDLTAVRRSKAVLLPMLLVPLLLFVLLPGAVGFAARSVHNVNIDSFLGRLPGNAAGPIRRLPEREQLVVLVNGYLLAPLFLIVPLMVSVVLAADAFAGEKERKTIEGLLHLPISDRDLFLAKLLGAFVPAVVVSWVGFACFAVVTNTVAWPVMHRIFVPTRLWGVMILWVAPAVAALGLGVMVRVSARARTSQEANQLGGAVILPLIFIALGQATGLLLVALPVALAVGAVLWVLAAWLVHGGITKFSRDRIALRVSARSRSAREHEELQHAREEDHREEHAQRDGGAPPHRVTLSSRERYRCAPRAFPVVGRREANLAARRDLQLVRGGALIETQREQSVRVDDEAELAGSERRERIDSAQRHASCCRPATRSGRRALRPRRDRR